MPEGEWLLFLAQLPATPSSLRVNVWRKLRSAGAASLQNGVWVLPRHAENILFLERLLGYVRQSGASSQIFSVQELNPAIHQDILRRFTTDRAEEYEEFLEQCAGFLSEIEKESAAGKFTFAELEENEQNFQRLRKWIVRIQKRDFFQSEKSQEAAAAFQDCLQKLQDYTHQVYAREGIETSSDRNLLSGEGELPGQENGDGGE